MTLIECKECSHKLSDKAKICPNCGAPISKEEKDLVEITIKKEKTSLITYLIYSLIFLSILFLISSDLIFLKSLRYDITLRQLQFSTYYQGFISSYPSIISNITFLACLLTILSKRFYNISKLLFSLNSVTSIILFIYLYNNNLRVGLCFFIIFIINTIAFLLPSIYEIKEEKVEISKKEIEKISKKNKKIETIYTKKIFNKTTIILDIIVILISLVSLLIINYYNRKDIYSETIIQANSDFQIEITNDYINIRASANTESSILGEVTKGDIYNVLDIYGGQNYIWYKINYKNQIGYIASSRENPYVKETYNDKLVVNIFCTQEESSCTDLLEFITRYQKNTKHSFLINYLDITDEHNNKIYNQALEYYQDENIVPYILIGTNKVQGYINNKNDLIIKVISEQKNNTTNIVDLLKKGNDLPEVTIIEENQEEKISEDTKKDSK